MMNAGNFDLHYNALAVALHAFQILNMFILFNVTHESARQ